MLKLGDKLKEIRESNNVTQGALAYDLGVSRTCLSNWERNVNMPKTIYLYKYMEIFKLSPDAFSDIYPTNDSGPLSPIDLMRLTKENLDKLCDYYQKLLKEQIKAEKSNDGKFHPPFNFDYFNDLNDK